MPLPKPSLELVMDVTAEVGELVVIGDTPEGLRRMIPILGGNFRGPQLRGKVQAGGADWQYVRSDGVTIAEAVYLLRTDDGVTIQVRNRGVRHGRPQILQRLFEGDDVDPSEYYFRSAPTFLAPPGRYAWLNRDVFVGTGARRARAVDLRFYRLT